MQLGKYTLDKRIGSGGMADVWLAKGPNGVCVLKCPHRHLCDNPEFVKMFLDEASILAQLHHPNIAQIYDLGNFKGAYYLAMEYVPGFDLMSLSLEHERQGELMAVELCARIVADAAAALHYAHEAKDPKGNALNIVHRDVTPHNILLSRTGVVKLIDFGVAKASTTMHRTQAGFVKGKYPYMSPEQITGQVIDRRVDVYALGLVLYELLTNVRAIPGNNEVEQIDAARAGRIRPIEQLRPNVPVPIRQILGACLHFDVSARYPTALALKEDLEKFLTLERQVVGQEDLLRLLRGVAADQGDTSLSARVTDLEQPISGDGPVVIPDAAGGKAQIDALGYSPTAPSMKSIQAMAPLVLSQPVDPQESKPTRLVERSQTTSKPAPAAPVPRGPLLALTGLSLLIIVMVLALWKPWAPQEGVVVPRTVADAGGIAGKVDTFTFPPEVVVDAGVPAVVAEVVDAGTSAPEETDAGVAVVAAAPAHLTISASVPAVITIDGEAKGNAPVELELPAGTYRVTAKGEGLDWASNVSLSAGQTKTLMAKPPAAVTPKKETGTLVLIGDPFCDFRVDDKPVAKLSLVEHKTTAGKHAVRCVMEGAGDWTKTVTVTPNEKTTVKFGPGGPL